MPNMLGYSRITTTVILDKTILNADVNDSAAIAFSKLLSAAINADLIPDGNDTRDIGSSSKKFAKMYCVLDYVTYHATHVLPSSDNTLTLGEPSGKFKEGYINELFGNCLGQIFIISLLGG